MFCTNTVKPVLSNHRCRATIQSNLCLVCLMLNVPVNNFSVKSGRSHRFLGITSIFLFGGGGGGGGGGGQICLAHGHNTVTQVGLEPLTSGSKVRGVNHHATTPVKPVLSDHIKQDIFLAFQTGGCLLLHESSAESLCMSFCTPFIQQLATTCQQQFPCVLNGWSLETDLTVVVLATHQNTPERQDSENTNRD